MPHPRFRERFFVLGPLAEVAPDMRDPVTGLKVWELLRALLRDESDSSSARSAKSRRKTAEQIKGRGERSGPLAVPDRVLTLVFL